MEPSVSDIMKDLVAKVVLMDQSVKHLKDMVETQLAWSIKLAEKVNGEMTDIKTLLKEVLEEVKNMRTDFNSYLQLLLLKSNGTSNICVVADAGNCSFANHVSQPSGQAHAYNGISFLPTTPHQAKANEVGPTSVGRTIATRESIDGRCNSTRAEDQSILMANENLKQLVEVASMHDKRDKMVGNILIGKRKEVVTSYKAGVSPISPASVRNSSPVMSDISSPSSSFDRRCHNHDVSGELLPAQKSIANKKRSSQIVPKTATAMFCCPNCTRRFEHSHSVVLHIRSCKKKFQSTIKMYNKEICADSAPVLNKNELSLEKFDDNAKMRRKILKMIKCQYCERNFPTQHQVRSHERVHTGERPFSCYVCSTKFAHGGNMIKHIKSKHPSCNPYVCRGCNRYFEKFLDVQNHRKECASATRNTSIQYETKTRSLNECTRNRRKSDDEDTITASEDEETPQARNVERSSSSPLLPTEKKNNSEISDDNKNQGRPVLAAIKFEIDADANPSSGSGDQCFKMQTTNVTTTATEITQNGSGTTNASLCQGKDDCLVTTNNFGIIDVKQEFQPD